MFGEVVRLFQVDDDRPLHLFVGYQHEIVKQVAQDALRQFVAPARSQALGGGFHRRGRYLARLPRQIRRLRPLRLHRDYLYVRVHALCHDASPARAAASAQRHHDAVNVRQIFQYLKRVCADARYQHRLVDRVNIAVALFFGEPLRVFVCQVKVRAVVNNPRAQALYRRHLVRVRALRHAHHAAYPKYARRVCDGLPVIARRRRDDAARPLFVRELRQQIDAAAHLERAQPLVIFVLDPDLRVQQRVKPQIAMQRRPPHIRRDAPPRLYNIMQCRSIPQSGFSCMSMSNKP